MEDMPECSNCCLQLETDLEEEELCFIVNSKEDLDIKYKNWSISLEPVPMLEVE